MNDNLYLRKISPLGLSGRLTCCLDLVHVKCSIWNFTTFISPIEEQHLDAGTESVFTQCSRPELQLCLLWLQNEMAPSFQLPKMKAKKKKLSVHTCLMDLLLICLYNSIPITKNQQAVWWYHLHFYTVSLFKCQNYYVFLKIFMRSSETTLTSVSEWN